jgi:hypothetical protein
MRKKIIGISGKSGSGKDYLADRIKSYAWSFFDEEPLCLTTLVNKKSFADSLKLAASKILRVPVVYMYSQEGKNTYIESIDMTIRAFLQQLGKLMRDNIDSGIWYKPLIESVKDDEICIIPDVRFKNEANAIIDEGGIVVRIQRKTTIQKWNELTGLSVQRTFLDSPDDKITKEGYIQRAKLQHLESPELFDVSETDLDDYDKFAHNIVLDDGENPAIPSYLALDSFIRKAAEECKKLDLE